MISVRRLDCVTKVVSSSNRRPSSCQQARNVAPVIDVAISSRICQTRLGLLTPDDVAEKPLPGTTCTWYVPVWRGPTVDCGISTSIRQHQLVDNNQWHDVVYTLSPIRHQMLIIETLTSRLVSGKTNRHSSLYRFEENSNSIL